MNEESMFTEVYKAQKELTEMTDDPTKLQLIYLSQIPMVLASIDDSLKSIRQTLSNMTGVMKEGQNDKNN